MAGRRSASEDKRTVLMFTILAVVAWASKLKRNPPWWLVLAMFVDVALATPKAIETYARWLS